MQKRPNVLWIMSDQHNANCTSYRNHPNVKTPNMDRIAQRGVDFTHTFANNPVCSPSRICFLTGQYMHTHGMYGNDHAEYPESNPDHIGCQFRKYGYQTAFFGKAHLTRRWVDEGFETYRYTDMCDATTEDPTTAHYFKYLVDNNLADHYEEGNPRVGREGTMDGSIPAVLPYEHSIEKYTAETTLDFLENRDKSRPFFVKMSFQRPHAPISPATEHFGMYDPEDIVLPDSASDYFGNKFAGKPQFMQEALADGNGYPLADPNPNRLKRCLASYYALISVIDMEIGRVLDDLESRGELDNTIVIYTADHGDFAGEHGLFHKNFGIYDSIQRIPLLISWPSGPKGMTCNDLVESIDLYPTLCELCQVPLPDGRDGTSLIPVVAKQRAGKKAAYCEWYWQGEQISAIRTQDFRFVFYADREDGELYDHTKDSGETINLWNHPDYLEQKLALSNQLLAFTMQHATVTGGKRARYKIAANDLSPKKLLHKHGRLWSDVSKL